MLSVMFIFMTTSCLLPPRLPSTRPCKLWREAWSACGLLNNIVCYGALVRIWVISHICCVLRGLPASSLVASDGQALTREHCIGHAWWLCGITTMYGMIWCGIVGQPHQDTVVWYGVVWMVSHTRIQLVLDDTPGTILRSAYHCIVWYGVVWSAYHQFGQTDDASSLPDHHYCCLKTL